MRLRYATRPEALVGGAAVPAALLSLPFSRGLAVRNGLFVAVTGSALISGLKVWDDRSGADK